MTRIRERYFAAFIASLLVVSMFGAAVVPAPTSAADGPEGMLALGSGQISEDVPEGADLPIRASDLEGAVYASEHAGSLEVVLTTPERADEHLGPNASVVANDEVAIVLRDDEIHEGRDVAVNLDVLEQGVGYVPSVAYGTHESGEEWHSPIEREGTVGVFHVPEFSSNSVTFTGGIELSGDAAGDGTTYQYELDSLDGVDDFAINMTGVTNTEWDNVSATNVADGDTVPLDVGGTSVGGPNGDPTVTFTGIVGFAEHTYEDQTDGGWGQTVQSSIVAEGSYAGETSAGSSSGINYGSNPKVSEWSGMVAFEKPGDSQDLGDSDREQEQIEFIDSENNQLWINVDNNRLLDTDDNVLYDGIQANTYYEIRVVFNWDAGTFDLWVDGSEVATGVNTRSGTFNGGIDSVSLTAAADGAVYTDNIDSQFTDTSDPSVDIDGDGTEEASYSGDLANGETVTRTISSLGVDDDTATISTASGLVNVDFALREHTASENPGVEINGYETTYDGTLAENETVSLATNEAWLREGTNNVTVNTSSPDGGPEALVGFEYSHDAAGTTKSVDVEATSWTESFNVSHTFPSAVADAESTLTFNEHVVEISSVEVRKNGGEWTETDAYGLTGTDLTVQLGDVDADSEIEIRATGYKIGVNNGAIDVIEPTVDGDQLDTQIEITDRGENFALDLSGSDRIHYTAEESWTGESAYVTVGSGGGQLLHLDDANVGSTARVRTVPLEVTPNDGTIAVHIEDQEALTFRLSDDGLTGSSSVDVTYHDTVSGDRYVLWSVTQEREIDADRAESPVEFSTGLTSSQTFEIQQRDRADALEGVAPQQQGGSSAPLVLVVPAVGLSVAGLFWAGRRFGGASGIRGNSVLLVGSTLVAIAALELVSPGTIASIWQATVFALGDAAAGGIGAVLAAFAVLVAVWQLQARTSANVPWWVTVPSVVIASIMALEAIRPGSILGTLEGVLVEVGGLVVLFVLGLIAYVIYTRRQRQQAEASTPDTQVTLDVGNNE